MTPNEPVQPEGLFPENFPPIGSPEWPEPASDFDVTEHALEMLDGMSQDRMDLLVLRTLRRLGVDEPEEVEGEEFAEAFAEELKLMLVSDSMQKLQRAGLVQPHGIGESGEILYELTQEGWEAAQQNSTDEPF